MTPRLPVVARLLTLLALMTFLWCGSNARADETAVRTAEHQKFSEGTIYANDAAAKDLAKLSFGSIVIVEHIRDGKPYAVSALFRARPGVNTKNDDWYELYYLADGTIVKSSADSSKFNHKGFLTKVIDDRLWILPLDSPHIASLIEGEVPEKHVTLPGAGPDRKTIKTDSRETAIQYLFAQPGYITHFEDGRAWIFAKGSAAAAHFKSDGPPEKHVTRVGAGPMRTTIKAPDADTIDTFLAKTNK